MARQSKILSGYISREDDGTWVARVPGIPELETRGVDEEAVAEALAEKVREYGEARVERGEEPFPEQNTPEAMTSTFSDLIAHVKSHLETAVIEARANERTTSTESERGVTERF